MRDSCRGVIVSRTCPTRQRSAHDHAPGVTAGGHVGGEQIDEAVVVDVGHVGPHGEPRRVGQDVRGDVGELAVAIVAVQMVGAEEVVRDVEIRAAVVVVVPPSGGQREVRAVDARLARDVGKAAAVVAVKMIELAGFGAVKPDCPAGRAAPSTRAARRGRWARRLRIAPGT